MCALQDQIKKLIAESKALLVHNINWSDYESSKFDAKNLKVTIIERKNIHICQSELKYKYLEYTKWDNNKACVAIGFNPAVFNPNEIDGTNIKIINALKEKSYGSYILLNLYPQVSPTKEDFDELNSEDSKFQNTLLKILDWIIKNKINTLIFWGRTVSINKEIYEKLQEMMKNNILFMTVKKGTASHYHPARVDIEIKKVNKVNLQDSYKLF